MTQREVIHTVRHRGGVIQPATKRRVKHSDTEGSDTYSDIKGSDTHRNTNESDTHSDTNRSDTHSDM